MKNLPYLILAAAAVALVCVAVCAFACFGPETGTALSLVGAAAMSFLMKDTALKVTKALPNGAATTNSDAIDLGTSTRGDFLANCEVLMTAPALTTGELGDTQTIIYTLQHDTDPAFGTVTDLAPNVITQTGAGGIGAVGATYRLRLPTTVKRYIRMKQVKTGATNASTSSGILEVLS